MIKSIFQKAREIPFRVYRASGLRDPARVLGSCLVCRNAVFQGGGEESLIEGEYVHSSCLLNRSAGAAWRAACANTANELRPLIGRALGPIPEIALLLKLERRRTPAQDCFGVIVELRKTLNARFDEADRRHQKLRLALDHAMRRLRHALATGPV